MNELQHIAVDEIYAAALDPVRWPAALQSIADCSNDVGAFLIYSRDDGRWGMFASDSLQGLMTDYLRDWGHRDIRAIRAHERGYFITRDAITDRDVVSDQEMDSDPLYTDLLPRHGLRYFAGVSVSSQPGAQVAVSIQRAKGRAPYTEAELADFARLARHVENGLKISLAMAEGELLASGLSRVLDKAGIGVLAFDRLGRVTFSNPQARRLLDQGETGGLRLAALGGLEAITQAALRRIERGGPILDPGEGPILIDAPGRDHPLVLRLLPLAAAPSLHPFGEAMVLALVCDPTAGNEIDPGLLRDLFGMTLGEARVAALVGGGTSLKGVAGRLGLKEQSVRSVLKRVFEKTRVSRQAELTALLQRLRLTS